MTYKTTQAKVGTFTPAPQQVLGVDGSGGFAIATPTRTDFDIAYSADPELASWTGTANLFLNAELDWRTANAAVYNDGTVTTSAGIYGQWTANYTLGVGEYICHARWVYRSNTTPGTILWRLYNETDATYHGNTARIGPYQNNSAQTVHAYLNLTASKTFSFRVTSYTATVEYYTNNYMPCIHVKFYRVD